MNYTITHSLTKKDINKISEMISKTWHYGEFSSPKISFQLGKVFLYSCLVNQSFIIMLKEKEEILGLIFGKINNEFKVSIKYKIQWIWNIIKLLSRKEGRKVSQIFKNVSLIDSQLLKQSYKKYEGELSFLMVNPNKKGLGLGKKLYQLFLEELNRKHINHFFLFTDTTCNYKFYNHQGLSKREEKTVNIEINNKPREMTFFLYDNY